MSVNYMQIIDSEKANAIYADGVKRARELRKMAMIAETIADLYNGAYITKRLNEKFASILGVNRAWLEKSVSGKVFYADILLDGNNNYGEYQSIRLAENGERRIDGAIVKRSAERYTKGAEAIEKGLEDFYGLVSQHNSIVTAYARIRAGLEPLTHDLVYCSI